MKTKGVTEQGALLVSLKTPALMEGTVQERGKIMSIKA